MTLGPPQNSSFRLHSLNSGTQLFGRDVVCRNPVKRAHEFVEQFHLGVPELSLDGMPVFDVFDRQAPDATRVPVTSAANTLLSRPEAADQTACNVHHAPNDKLASKADPEKPGLLQSVLLPSSSSKLTGVSPPTYGSEGRVAMGAEFGHSEARLRDQDGDARALSDVPFLPAAVGRGLSFGPVVAPFVDKEGVGVPRVLLLCRRCTISTSPKTSGPLYDSVLSGLQLVTGRFKPQLLTTSPVVEREARSNAVLYLSEPCDCGPGNQEPIDELSSRRF